MADPTLVTFFVNVSSGKLPSIPIWAVLPGALITGDLLSDETISEMDKTTTPESPGDNWAYQKHQAEILSRLDLPHLENPQIYVYLYNSRVYAPNLPSFTVDRLSLNLDLISAWGFGPLSF